MLLRKYVSLLSFTYDSSEIRETIWLFMRLETSPLRASRQLIILKALQRTILLLHSGLATL